MRLFADRFPLVVAAIAALPARSCLIATAKSSSRTKPGSLFELLRSWCHDSAAVRCAFDVIELDGKALRRAPLEERKQKLAKLLREPHPGIALNGHYVGDGDIVYRQGPGSSAARASCRSGSAPSTASDAQEPGSAGVRREAEGY